MGAMTAAPLRQCHGKRIISETCDQISFAADVVDKVTPAVWRQDEKPGM